MKRLAGAFVAVLLSTTAVARADGDPTVQAEAEFQRAKGLIAQSRWSEACPVLAESYRLDPAGGTLQNLAVCYETIGKWASAYARFFELKTNAKRATPPKLERVKLADEHLAKVTPKVAHLVVVSDEAAAEVEIEGVKYQRVSWAAGIALDPGPHDVTVSVVGKRPYKSTVTIPNEGVEQKLQIPALETLPVADTKVALTDERHATDEQRRARAEEANRLRRTGYFLGAGGLIALAGAGAFGFLTVRANSQGKALCHAHAAGADWDSSGSCIAGSPAQRDANDDKSRARAFAVVTDVLGGLGLVGVGAGVYFAFVRAGSIERDASIRIGPTLGGVAMNGTF